MLIAVLRRPDGLHELSVDRDEPFCPPTKHAPLASVGRYVERLAAVDAVEELRDAVPGPSSLAAALRVLARSVPDASAFDGGVTVPGEVARPMEPRRTAANPRGFRGTKYKPPKAPAPGRFDFRPHLDGAHRERTLLKTLAYEDASSRTASLPALFQRYFLWSLRDADAPILSQLVAAYWALDLASNADLRRIVAAIIAQCPDAATVSWVRALERVQPERRLAFGELLLETEGVSLDRPVGDGPARGTVP